MVTTTAPIPDPTVLTTQQLLREILSARELLESKIITTGEAIFHLQHLHEEKFKSVEKQFIERDTRTESTQKDSKVAIDAALKAAKEAVEEQNKSNAMAIAKSEASFTKQIDQILVLVSTLGKGIDDKIEDIKSRVQTIEGHKQGANEVWGYVIAAFGLLVAGLSIFVKGYK